MSTQSGDSNHNPTAHLDLMPTGADGIAVHATHVAVNNGDWFSSSTWASGQVPGNGALVHIPEGVSVSYEGSSEAKLFMVRVDGALKMYAENGTATKMVVDTMVTSGGSHLLIDADATTDGTVDIVIAETDPAAHQSHFNDRSDGDGVIGRYTWDPEQLSLGVVASGKVEVRGQDVEAGLRLAEGPNAGATELVFNIDANVTGWQTGQSIVVGGTKFLSDGADGTLQTEDEVRTITDVRMVGDQMIVTIDRALIHDHSGPSDPDTGLELTSEVGNLSRNVRVSSEIADQNGDGQADRGTSLGDALGADDHYVTQRGHLMFMHNDDVSVLNTELFGLGRTDKSILVDDYVTGGIHDNRLHVDANNNNQFDPGIDYELQNDRAIMENPRGRYALHLHEANGHDHAEHGDDHTGHEHGVIGPCPDTGGPICHCGDQDGDGIGDCLDEDFFDGAYIEGVVVWGSPGWGIVQHSTDAILKGNVVYDVAGSAFVAELGDETGRWEDNLAIGTYGVREVSPTEDAEAFNEDDGGSGVAFYSKSRALEMTDNTAISSGRAGFFFHGNGAKMREVDADASDAITLVAQGRDTVEAEDAPITVFEGNTVIAAREGIRITTDPSDAVRKFSDVWSHFKDFTAWEVDESGVSITYSSKYIFENFLILGTEDKVTDLAQAHSSGFFFKTSAADITVLNAHVEHFDNAILNWSFIGDRQEYRRGLWDPKDPHTNPGAPNYDSMGLVEGIENPIYNLFNNAVIDLTYDNLSSAKVAGSKLDVEVSPGVIERFKGIVELKSHKLPGTPGLEIELLGDSRDGGLVALWREDLANASDPEQVLRDFTPLAYQDDVFLNQIYFTDGQLYKRNTLSEYRENINADVWSGTILEFAKEDGLGRQVFLYGDFSPLDPGAAEHTVTTNERLVLSREMIDGTLAKRGYYTVEGIDDVKFVKVEMGFTDRADGTLYTYDVLVALDLAWELPEDAVDAGLLLIDANTLVAPQYRVFDNGVLVAGRKPIVLGEAPDGIGAYQTGTYTSDESEDLAFGAESDRVNGGGGDDIMRGFASADWLDGGSGHDALFGGNGWDRLMGGEGDDLLDGHLQRDFLYGGEGDDRLQGGVGRDDLEGGAGNDSLIAGNGKDVLYGGDGDDALDGGRHQDHLFGGDGGDHVLGGFGGDTLFGGEGDDVLGGNGGADVIHGDGGSDLINGGNKADILYGGDGADNLQGEQGIDRLFGGTGDDLLQGHAGTDALYGGEGNDGLAGGSGKDKLFGGDGADTVSGGTGDDRMTGGSGADRFIFDSSAGLDVITDFEDGIDAIEFMIESFGFTDLVVRQSGNATALDHAGGTIRLLDTDASTIDADDFEFNDPG